jgi:hypothetical protein
MHGFEEDEYTASKKTNTRLRRRRIHGFEEDEYTASKKTNTRLRRRRIHGFEEDEYTASKKTNTRLVYDNHFLYNRRRVQIEYRSTYVVLAAVIIYSL